MPIRPRSRHTLAHLALAGTALAAPLWAHAQVTLKPDGEWRSLFTAGASVSTGNTDAKSATLAADVVRLRSFDKWSFDGAGQYATSNGARTADRENGTALYTRDITPAWFGFGQLDLLHDVLADISSRTTLGSGLGYHVFKEPALTWDISGGLAYTLDRYEHPQLVDDETRSRYNHAELLLSEESNHKFSETTTFRQKLTVYPNLHDGNDVRTIFDTGLSVAMTKKLALTATFEHRYDSRPGEGLGKTDTQLVTGVSLRFD
jgi:putative salt-induced outer membrane protein